MYVTVLTQEPWEYSQTGIQWLPLGPSKNDQIFKMD